MAEHYDVFLCYPGTAAAECQRIVKTIEDWGLKVFYHENLRPGDWSDKAIGDAINTARVAIVCVGDTEARDWYQREVSALVREQDKRDCRVIPLLLPKANDRLIPWQLRGDVRIDMRKGITDEKILELQHTVLDRKNEATIESLYEGLATVSNYTVPQRDHGRQASVHVPTQNQDPEAFFAPRGRGQLPSYKTAAELRIWLSSQKHDHSLLKSGPEQQFLASLRSDPEFYTAFAEEIAREDPPNPWAERLILRGFIGHFEIPAVNSELRRAFDRWLGFVHPAGDAMRGASEDDEQTEQRRKRLQERLGHPLNPGELNFAGFQLTVVEHPGLLRLGQLALAVMSRFPLSRWISMIAKGCVTDAVMDYAKKYHHFSWVVRLSPEPVWDEIEAEVSRLVEHGHLVTKQAAYRLLSFHGSEQASKLQKEHFSNPLSLFPQDSDLATFDDPCFHPWRLEDCESCLERTDLNTMLLARQLEPWYPEPALDVPGAFVDRLAKMIEKISPENVWENLWNDPDLETLEGALCAAAPELYAQLVWAVAATSERRGKALWHWTLELGKHSLLLREKEQQILYQTWRRLSQEPELDSQERHAEQFLFTLVLMQLSASDQLTHILQRPEGPHLDLVRFKHAFRPLTDAAVCNALLDGADTTPIRATRVLWFLSLHVRSLSPEVVQKAFRFLSHEESLVRFNASRLLYASNHPTALKALENINWSYQFDNDPRENHWCSLIYASHGHHLKFSELSRRLDPVYLGFAVQERGLDQEEILQYAETLHQTWQRIVDQVPQPTNDLTIIEIDAPVDPAELHPCRQRLVTPTGLQLIGWFNPHAYWGRVPNESDSYSKRRPWEWPTEQEEQERRRIHQEEVERQHRLGNPWFARVFYSNALADVVKQRPDFVDLWLTVSHDQLKLASTFYECLCSVLLQETPERGIGLYHRLREEKLPVRIVGHGIERLDFFLFQAPPSSVVRQEWERRLDECRTDKELMEVVVVAEHGNGARWLQEICHRELASEITWRQARALILLGLSRASSAPGVLKRYTQKEVDCWLTEVASKAEQYRRHNDWGWHQYSEFINAEDDVRAWAAFRLFLRCVDRRFWLWWPRFEDLSPELPNINRRRAFFENNRDTLRNSIRENEKPFENVFLGTKILAGEVEPWLEDSP